MRPEALNPLFAEVEALPGVGPQVAKALKRLDIARAVDLAFHLPDRHYRAGARNRRQRRSARPHRRARADPVRESPAVGRGPLRIFASDSDGNTITLVYFNNPGWAKKQSADRARRKIVSGRLDAYGDEWQIVHPEVLAAGKAADLPLREPVYPLDRRHHQPPHARAGAGRRSSARPSSPNGSSRRFSPARAGARGAPRSPKRIRDPVARRSAQPAGL